MIRIEIASVFDRIRGFPTSGGLMQSKPRLEEVLQWCEQVKPLVVAIFTKKEMKKGDRNKWRGKARRLLRRIGAAL
jgi:hypothetical protein